ncbi:hypothetical protein FCM35_KLT01268 [Carex littledalei]|uniref:Uncharacterized protein n=1 Tax=Carex littledalei TaxID=544730 RepID=A0A833R945_9POAL|nr:hypothetical protein FCM35_KLT01268 [Carex littledalei]
MFYYEIGETVSRFHAKLSDVGRFYEVFYLLAALEQPKFVPLPMRPLPIKVQPACTCRNSAPAQSTGPPETAKVTDFSGSQNEALSRISNAINEGTSRCRCCGASWKERGANGTSKEKKQKTTKEEKQHGNTNAQ